MSVELLPGAEPCPGHLAWSAFGASYPDTVCSNSLEWDGRAEVDLLCDADDDYRLSDIPCPFCDWRGFADYLWGGGCKTLLWAADETPVPEGTEIHFHDAPALWWSATHPVRGEEIVLARENGARTLGTPEAVNCEECGVQRSGGDIDYHPLQVIHGLVLGQTPGWYSGDDGEMCGPCVDVIMRKANG